MPDENMISFGDAFKQAIEKMGSPDKQHIEASEGDFIDEEGYLCCGVCGKHKEYRLSINIPGAGEFKRVVPSMCDCRKAEFEREEREAKLRQERVIVDELKSYSLTDERFRESTFDAFRDNGKNGKALRIAQRYVEHFDEMYESSTGLLMYGPPGTGKTFLSACIANALMERGIPVLVTSIIKLTSGFGEELQAILHKMKSARLLVLDDFGAERNTDFKVEQIFDVIDTRYMSKKPMIITTNIPLKDLKDEPDERRWRVNDRILGVCHPVKMDWESWRRVNVMENYKKTVSLLEDE